MAKSITHATVNLTRAAHAAGMPVRVLRYAALDIPLLGQPEPAGGRWRRFSVSDCVRFAIVARLQGFGIGLPAAVEVLGAAVDRHLCGLLLCGVDLPPAFLVNRLGGLTVRVVPGPGGLDVYSAPSCTAPGGAEAVLILNIGAIAATTVARLDACKSTRVDTRAPFSRPAVNAGGAGTSSTNNPKEHA